MSVGSANLSEKQKNAIEQREGEYLLLAGPGTGKTEVIAHRIANLIFEGTDPNKIVAITFSNKAKTEMIERLHKFKGLEETDFRISTLHSFALEILRKKDKRKKFLYLEDECEILFNDAVEDVIGLEEPFDIKDCINWVNLNKYSNISCDKCEVGLYKDVYSRFEYLLEYNNANDINGVVMNSLIHIDHFEGINLFDIEHLLVDEYQDINHSEYEMIKKIYEGAKSLFIVGDDDQSIYAWRGADPKIIHNFNRDFKKSKIDYLENSYRCTGNILNGSLSVVSKCKYYYPKIIKSVKGEGELIQILVAEDEEKESEWISNKVAELLGKNAPNDIAIITPQFNRAREVSLGIRKKGIKVTFWGQSSLFKDLRVKKIIALMRIINDRTDNLAIRFFLENVKKFGIGDKTIRIIKKVSLDKHVPIWEVLTNPSKYECGKMGNKISKFYEFINILDEDIGDDADECINKIASSLSIPVTNEVRELSDISDNLEKDSGISDLLKMIIKERRKEAGEIKEKEKNGVNVMSMHASKGLGFKIVFITGMEDDLLPRYDRDIDEQRRLCYVAMTRAKEQLYMSYCREITGPAAQGHKKYNPSLFLGDIPDEVCNVIYY
jgi:DNA helicase-2/ATP-dependent DNA helicase PcrA